MTPKYGRGGRKRRNRRARRCPHSHTPNAKTVESVLNAEFGPAMTYEEYLCLPKK